MKYFLHVHLARKPGVCFWAVEVLKGIGDPMYGLNEDFAHASVFTLEDVPHVGSAISDQYTGGFSLRLVRAEQPQLVPPPLRELLRL